MAMIVQCNQCGTKFKVDETRVGPSGAKVRCTKCKNVFAVQAPKAAGSLAPAPVAAPPEDDDFGNKTQMYKADTLSGEIMVNSRMAAPAGTSKGVAPRPAAPPEMPPAAPPPKKAAVPAPRGESGDKTNVLDTSAYLKGLKVPELPSDPVQDQPTRVGKVEGLAKLTAIAEEPGALEDVREARGVEVVQPAPPPEPSLSDKKPAERRAPLGSEENPMPMAGKGDFRVPTQALVPPSSIVSEAALARGKTLNRVISIAAGAVLFLGFVFYGFNERIYSGLRNTLGQLPDVQLDTATDLQGVRLTRTRTILYPMKNGSAALMVAGEAVNHGEQPQNDVDVVVELRDRSGKPVKAANVPLGMLLDMEQVVAAQSQDDWQNLILEWRRKAPPAPIQPAVPTPFLAVLVDPPQPLGEYAQSIHLAPTQALPPPAVPEPPPPVVVPAPPPPPPQAAVEPPKVDKHGRKLLKGGKKVHKSTRRAADE